MAVNAANEAKFKIVGFLRKPNLRMQEISTLDLVKEINNVIDKVKPQVIFTHHPGDLNSDHRICYEAVVTACRPFSTNLIEHIYAFEVPSSSEWAPSLGFPSFEPNYYVNIQDEITEKLRLLQFYEYEMREFPHPRSSEMIKSLAQVRGAAVGFSYAEAFSLVRSLVP
jgi:LmbE family N-acetylglucosaminyl deacetylase